jgi:uncharacterized protein YbcI
LSATPKYGVLVVAADTTADQEVCIAVGKHECLPARATGGMLNAAIARAVVQLQREYVGRGPTRAQAFYRNEIVVVMLESTMTTSERNLVAAGEEDAVLRMRSALQALMRPHLVATIERITGCKVEAFMSASHLDPDLAAEIFVLDRPVRTPPDDPEDPRADS